MGTKCPTCSRDDFSSKKGMRSHHKMAHGESITREITCKECGDIFEVLPYRVENEDKKFCSSKCQHKHQKNRVNSVCENCGKKFEYAESYDRQFCSWSCRNDGIKRRETSTCQWCEDKFEHHKSDDRKFCSVTCTENWFSSEERPTSNGFGEEHWAYIDGSTGTSRWYGPNWSDNREVACSRTDCCEHPNCDTSDNLHCHHIVPFRYFKDGDNVDYESANDTENLIMLCPKHHAEMDWMIRTIEEAPGYGNTDSASS